MPRRNRNRNRRRRNNGGGPPREHAAPSHNAQQRLDQGRLRRELIRQRHVPGASRMMLEDEPPRERAAPPLGQPALSFRRMHRYASSDSSYSSGLISSVDSDSSSSSSMGEDGGSGPSNGAGELLHSTGEEGSSGSSNGTGAPMNIPLLKAAMAGDVGSLMNVLASNDPAVLLGRTAQNNTCLHISCVHGHEAFCREVVFLDPSLLTAVNANGETPLLTAVTSGQTSLASFFLECYRVQGLGEMIRKKDRRHGCNALHYAIQGGHTVLALELIRAERALSQATNRHNESPMYMAVVGRDADVLEKLLEYPDSTDVGPTGCNALHAAVTSGNSAIVRMIVEARPQLATAEDDEHNTPIHLAVLQNSTDLLRVLLEHDERTPPFSLLGDVDTTHTPLLCAAAMKGHVDAARMILHHCPDAPCWDADGSSCLHVATKEGHIEFVRFVMLSKELRKLVNMRDRNGKTALDIAAKMKNETGDTAKDDEVKKKKKKLKAVLRRRHQHRDDVTARNTSGGTMHIQLLRAAMEGDAGSMNALASSNQAVLLGRTAQKNTCLHISCVHGHVEFCRAAVDLEPSLLAEVNTEGETPLLIAVTSGHTSLASILLGCYRVRELGEKILKQDKHGCNVLHHAIRSGHKGLALELIRAEPNLSRAVNKYNESPMFIAVMKNYKDVFEELMEVSGSSHQGINGWNALHAAVRNGNKDIAESIVEARSDLAKLENDMGNTPIHWAVVNNMIEVLTVLLRHDNSLGNIVSSDGLSLLSVAAFRGHVDAAKKILEYCPDAPYCDAEGWTCLHEAVETDHTEFAEFVVKAPQLQKLVNMRDRYGNTALHLAVRMCNPKMVAALLGHKDRDVTMLDNNSDPAIWETRHLVDYAKTLNWNEVSMLMLNADPDDKGIIYNLQKAIKEEVMENSRKNIKSLTEAYTQNTSLVAILIATITFAAAFTLPGGYSSDAESQGLPIMARKIAFQAFLISDTLAMCCSLSVAFICIIARWEDLEFLLHYRSLTKKLMWFAYMATTTAFATGLYTVLAPRVQWLAIAICIVSLLLPILTKLIGEWPVLKLRFRLGRTFKSEFLNMV